MSNKNIFQKLFTLIHIILVVGALVSLIGIDGHLINGQKVTFVDENGDTLVGKYYPGEVAAGVIFLEGFGSDQIALRSVVSEFKQLGVHMLTFDFSGQGKSSGIVGFDNAATDVMAKQVILAKSSFKNLTGLADQDILYVGHSMGSRMALQAAAMDTNNVSGLILLGTQINLLPNIQSSFFTGVDDSNLTWVQNLGPKTPPCDILMLSGSWDDVLPVNGAFKLYEQLVNQTISDSFTQRLTIEGKVKELVIYKAMLHNYEVYSPRLIRKALNWASESLGLGTTNYLAPRAAARITMWFIALISFFASVLFGIKWYDKSVENEEIEEPKASIQITELEIEDSKKYLTRKLLLLLAALPIAVILASTFMAIPVGLPIFNVVYVGIFGGLGILLLILYRTGKMPATSGKWLPRISFNKEDYNFKRLGIALVIALSVIGFAIIFTRSGFFHIYPGNWRLLWLGLFTLFSIPGFYIGQIEAEVARNDENIPKRFFTFNTLIILLPFFIQTLFFIILGSTSGFLGGIHGLIILMITILAGDVVQRIAKSPLLTAIFQSLLLQLLVLPQGSLFLIFY